MDEVFSVNYEVKKFDGYRAHSVDWCWPENTSRWTTSVGTGCGGHWVGGGKLDEEAYTALLTRFGLESCRLELPLEKIAKMSPEELGRMRREKEGVKQLPRLEIISDRVGDHRSIA